MVDSAIITSKSGAQQPAVGGQRTLVKFAASTPKDSMTLDEFGTKEKQRFNQFEGKQSSYKESLYTSSLDESKITAQQRKDGERIEREINS